MTTRRLHWRRSLLVDAPAAREAGIAELMSVDPALTIWTACWAGRGGEHATVCLGSALVVRATTAGLNWPPDGPPDGAADERPWRDVPSRWRELSADSIAVANLAADQATDDVRAAEAFLLGLLHNAADWLRSCGPRISLAKPDSGCLPAWLVTLLRERSRSSRHETVLLIMQGVSASRKRPGVEVVGSATST